MQVDQLVALTLNHAPHTRFSRVVRRSLEGLAADACDGGPAYRDDLMGSLHLRYYRRFRIAPGIHLNLSKGGVSASLRGRGIWYTVSRGGRMRTTIGIPRTGVYLTKVSRLPTKKGTSAAPAGRSLGAQILRGLLITFAIYAAIWLGVILLAAR